MSILAAVMFMLLTRGAVNRRKYTGRRPAMNYLGFEKGEISD